MSDKNYKILVQNRPSALSQPGGDTVVMQQTISELKKLGLEMVLDLEGNANLAEFDLVHIFNFATPQLTEMLASKAWQAGKPYVVTTLCEDAPSYRNQAMHWAGFLCGYVASGQNQNWYQQNYPNFNKITPAESFNNTWVAKHASALITNGPAESSVICRNYGNLPINEVYLGFDRSSDVSAELFHKAYGVKDFVLSVGRLEFRKNQLALLKALENSELTVVLAAGGFSYDQDYANACRSFKRTGQTIITERLTPELLASAYKCARVHALPSWYELPGLVSLEAAYYGCQVVVSDCGTTRDYLGNRAWYCKPSDPDSIKAAVTAAWQTEKNAELQQHVTNFTWPNMAKQVYEVYQKVLTKVSIKQEQEATVNIKTMSETDGATIPSTIAVGGYDMAPGVTEFQDLLERGELAAKERQYNIAHDLLARAEQVNPRSARAIRARGAVYLAENMNAAARKCFEKSLQIDSQDAKAYSGLGMCLMHEKQPETAYQCFVTSLEYDSSNLVTILQLLECSYLLSRFTDLTRVLEGYINSHPNDQDMHFCLAGAYFKQGEFEKAEQICTEIQRQNSQHGGVIELIKAIADAKSQSVDHSQVGIKQVTTINRQIDQESIDMRLERTLAELEDKKHKREYIAALDLCNQQIASGEWSATYLEKIEILKAELLLLTGKLAEGAQIFHRILEINPKSARAICGQGALAATTGQWAEAKKLFARAATLDARSDVALAGLAMCACSSNETEQAWNYYLQALHLNPENLRALLGIMEIGYPQRRFAEVEQALRNYLDLHPADAQFLYSLCGCLYAQNKIDLAVQELDRLSVIDPAHKGASELRAVIAERSNAVA